MGIPMLGQGRREICQAFNTTAVEVWETGTHKIAVRVRLAPQLAAADLGPVDFDAVPETITFSEHTVVLERSEQWVDEAIRQLREDSGRK